MAKFKGDDLVSSTQAAWTTMQNATTAGSDGVEVAAEDTGNKVQDRQEPTDTKQFGSDADARLPPPTTACEQEGERVSTDRGSIDPDLLRWPTVGRDAWDLMLTWVPG